MMRRFGLGLAFAMMIGVLAGASAAAAADKDDSSTKVPALIQQLGLPCTVTASRTIVKDGVLGDGATASIYEVACQEGLGQVVIARNKAPMVQAEDCLLADAPGPDKKPSKLACTLPANANPKASFGPALAKLGRECTVADVRGIGSTATQGVYEVLCKDDGDYILMLPRAAGAEAAVNPCIGYDEIENAATKCTLSTEQERNDAISKMLTQGGKPCQMSKHHFVGTTADHNDYIEVACQGGKGYVLQTDAAGKFKAEIDCAQASGIAGGCTLTDTRAAQTEQNSVYTRLAKKAGFNCDVAKYAAFASDKPDVDVVELQCSNRTDGGVGFFPNSGTAQVLDCIRAQTEGYRCTYTKDSDVYPTLNAALKTKGKSSCVVNGARGMGRTKTGEDFVEVACSDGGPGWVLDYPPNAIEPSSLLNCAQASSMGGCQLPTNIKH